MTGTQSFSDALKALRDQFGRQDEPLVLDPGREALGSAAGLYVAVGIAVLLMQGIGSSIPTIVLIQHGPVLILISLGAAYIAARQKPERIPAFVFFTIITQALLLLLSLLLSQFSAGGGIIIGILIGLNFVAMRRVAGFSTMESIGAGLVIVIITMGVSVWLVTATDAGRAIAGL